MLSNETPAFGFEAGGREDSSPSILTLLEVRDKEKVVFVGEVNAPADEGDGDSVKELSNF